MFPGFCQTVGDHLRERTDGVGTLTLDMMMTQAVRQLREAGIGNARNEGCLLLQAALGWGAVDVLSHPHRVVSEKARTRFNRLLTQRCARRPMGQILGVREFWSLPFYVEPCTLEPRPDSECLVEAAMNHLRQPGGSPPSRDLDILDLGTGTGCLLLSILHECSQARGVGIDIDHETCRVARRNASALGLTDRVVWVVADWATSLDCRFDVILCNPPYIPDGVIAGLMPEVARYEPRRALAGGVDGLDCYRQVLAVIDDCIKAEGMLFLEVGQGQADRVEALCRDRGWHRVKRVCDLEKRERCLVLTRRPCFDPVS